METALMQQSAQTSGAQTAASKRWPPNGERPNGVAQMSRTAVSIRLWL